MRTTKTRSGNIYHIYVGCKEVYELDDSNCGVCLKCGNDQYNCEPDASNYTCEECGKPYVFGIAELAMMGRLVIIDEDYADEIEDVPPM